MARPSPSPLVLSVAVVVAAVAITAGGGCRASGVQLSYRPEAGDRHTYEVVVTAVSEVTIAGEAPRRQEDRLVLHSEHEVLDVDADGTDVRIRLLAPDGSVAARRFVARLDRAGHLRAVERVEHLPADVLGDLTLGELLPAAAGVRPSGPVAPGDRWKIRERVSLPGVPSARLHGEGRLVAMGVEGGRDVASVATRTELPVRRRSADADGRFELTGTQTTEVDATHVIADGSVLRAQSRSHGRFELELLPPEGTRADPVAGTLTVTVESTTRRLD